MVPPIYFITRRGSSPAPQVAFSSYLASAADGRFLAYRRKKEELAATSLVFHSLKNILGGVRMTTAAAMFATA
jgi:hypothetical protein